MRTDLGVLDGFWWRANGSWEGEDLKEKSCTQSNNEPLHAPIFNYTSVTAIPAPCSGIDGHGTNEQGLSQRENHPMTVPCCGGHLTIQLHVSLAWEEPFLKSTAHCLSCLDENQHNDPGRSSSCLLTAQRALTSEGFFWALKTVCSLSWLALVEQNE